MILKDRLAVLIPDAGDIDPYGVLSCLAQVPGLRIHGISRLKWPSARFSRYWSSFHIMPDDGEMTLLDSIAKIVHEEKIDIVLPVSEAGIRFISCHRQRLSDIVALAHTCPCDRFDIAADKWLLAEFMAKHAIPHPATILVKNKITVMEQIDQISFPVLLKPRKDHGSGNNIVYLNDQSSLLDFIEKHPELSENYILQNFIYGQQDRDCSVLCENGEILAYTIQQPYIAKNPPFGAATAIKFIQDDQTLRVVQQLVTSLSWHGIANVDLIFDERDQQVKVLEMNTRYWLTLVGSLAAAVNFPYLACLAGLGKTFENTQYELRVFCLALASVKQLINKFTRRDEPMPFRITAFRITDTSWPYVFSDPLPFIVQNLRRIIDRF